MKSHRGHAGLRRLGANSHAQPGFADGRRDMGPISGSCNIVAVGKRRDGGTRYWCLAHRSDATAKYGRRAATCRGALIPPIQSWTLWTSILTIFLVGLLCGGRFLPSTIRLFSDSIVGSTFTLGSGSATGRSSMILFALYACLTQLYPPMGHLSPNSMRFTTWLVQYLDLKPNGLRAHTVAFFIWIVIGLVFIHISGIFVPDADGTSAITSVVSEIRPRPSALR